MKSTINNENNHLNNENNNINNENNHINNENNNENLNFKWTNFFHVLVGFYR